MKNKQCYLMLFLLSILFVGTGCGSAPETPSETHEEVFVFMTVMPTQTPVPSATAAENTPAVTTAPVQNDTEHKPPDVKKARSLSEIENEITNDILSNNVFLFHKYSDGKNGSALKNETPLGVFSYRHASQETAKAGEWISELVQISTDGFTETEKNTYNRLMKYCGFLKNSESYYYYREPLDPETGMHRELPFELFAFQIQSEDDIDLYFSALKDMPRYFEQIVRQETQRARMEIFMTSENLYEVLAFCDQILSEDAMMTFRERFSSQISDIAHLSSGKQNGYLNQFDESIQESFVPAYRFLHDSLMNLSSACRGSATLLQEEKEALLYDCCRKGFDIYSADEMLSMIEDAAEELISISDSMVLSGVSAAERKKTYSVFPVRRQLRILKSYVSDWADMSSDSFETDYVRVSGEPYARLFEDGYASIRRKKDNTLSILFFYSEKTDDRLAYLQAMRETIPGKALLIGSALIDVKKDTVKLVNEDSFLIKGLEWKLSELNASVQTHYDGGEMQYDTVNEILQNVLLPAAVSIRVNFFDASEKEIANYIEQYGFNVGDYASSCYLEAVRSPAKNLLSAVGYAAWHRLKFHINEVFPGQYTEKDIYKMAIKRCLDDFDTAAVEIENDFMKSAVDK